MEIGPVSKFFQIALTHLFRPNNTGVLTILLLQNRLRSSALETVLRNDNTVLRHLKIIFGLIFPRKTQNPGF